MNTERPLHQPTPYQSERFVLLLGIILIASTLRTPMTSVGPLLPFIQEGLGLSNAVAGSITTIPLLAFALLSPFAPRIAERVGAERLVFAALLFIAIGIGVRYFMYVPALFIGTVFIGAGIAVGNVLLPGIVKKNFPLHIGLVTGLYGISMNIVAAIGSGVSEPIARAGLNWNGSLAIWGFVVFFALVVWGVQLSKNKNQTDRFCHPLKPHLWRSRLAWSVTAFMGIQSLHYYTMMTWLPQLLATHGYTPTSAGGCLPMMQGAIVPMTFIIPVLAGRMKDQRIIGIGIGVCFLLANIGLYTGVLIPVWVILMGIACGSGFGLSMMLFALRTSTSIGASKLSGMAQAFGYLLAAFGPMVFGVTYDFSGSWQAPLLILATLSIFIVFVSLRAGKGQINN
ncbi:LOW QUALITY PROTEIN: hypothetical protein JCM19039_2456 [Geomicrobium sp. JCM 19039]|nr:LOW QUALITY PROTEIN: hypothetical protein JCM19039_2456 [Geomicrobium sp. JCM 19039]